MGHRAKTEVRCGRCRVHRANCFCEDIPTFETRARLCLVMHFKEVIKPSATGPLALASLKNSEVHEHGVKGRPLDLSHLHDNKERRVVVLFPSEDARPLNQQMLDEDPRPVTLIVPDGNWRQATRIPARVPGIIEAERVTLPHGPETRWGVRRETRDGGLATYEAIARAFGILESSDLQKQLEQVFERMVAITFAQRGTPQ